MKLEFLKKIKFIIPNSFNKSFFILFFFLLINSLLEIFSIGMLLPLFEMVKDNDTKLIYFIENFEFFNIFEKNIYNIYFILIFLFLITFFFKTFFHIQTIKFSVNLIANLKTKLSYEIFKNYSFKDFLYFKKKNSSSIIRNLIKEISEFCDRFLLSFINLFLDLLIILCIIVFLIIHTPQELFFLVIYSFIFFFIYYFLNRKKLFNAGEQRQNLDEKKYSILSNFLNNIKEVKILNTEKFYLEAFNSFTNKFEKTFAKFVIISLISKPLFELLIIIFLCLVFIIKLFLQVPLNDIIFNLSILSLGCLRILPSISRLMFNIGQVIFSYPSINEIYNDRSLFNSNYLSQIHKKKLIKFKTSIKFKDVSFGYELDNYIFKNFNFEIKKGEKICIIGPSGRGKTTMVEILIGLIQPTSGHILVDNKVFDITNEKLNLTYLTQDTMLFDDTIKNNIILNKNFNQKKYNETIKLSLLDVFINSNVDKDFYQVGVFGNNLSGGQKQKVAFARAIYSDAELIILDEPFTALDDENREIIKTNIFKVFQNKTVIFISHDKRLINEFDNVIEIDKL